MDSETHFSIVFNIYGGSNQILPNATSATQNYYGDEAELEKDDVSMDKEPALSPEAMRLFSYINKVEDLRIYLVQIAECTNAVELARVIVKMGERETEDYFGRDGEGAFYLVVLSSHTFVRIGQDCQQYPCAYQ